MRSPAWILALTVLAVAGRGPAQTPQEEIARLEAELERLRAENRLLREKLSRLEPPSADEKAESPPDVALYAPRPGTGADAGKIVFTWKAAGSSLADRPVSLFYAESTEGPWRLMGTKLKAEGSLTWQRPAGIARRLFLRCTARDRAGKEVVAQTPEPIFLSPQVSPDP